MKKIAKTILTYILTATVFLSTVTGSYITAYATETDDTIHGGGGTGNGGGTSGGGHEHEPITPDNRTWQEKLNDFLASGGRLGFLACCQVGAVFHGEYDQVLENFNTYFIDEGLMENGEINPDLVTYDEATDSITMDISELLNTLTGQIGLKTFPANYKTDVNAKYQAVREVYGNDSSYFAWLYSSSPPDNSAVYVYEIDLDKYYLVRYDSYSSGGYTYYLKAYDKNTLEQCKTAFIKHEHHKPGYSLDGFLVSSGSYVLNEEQAKYFGDALKYSYDSFGVPSSSRPGPGKITEFYNNVAFSYWESYDSMIKFILDGESYLGSAFGQSSTITIPVSDLSKDWEKAYNDIVKNLDEIKEATGERPTQEQIDDAIKGVLGKLEDIGGDIGDIGGDVETIAKTLDDLYKMLEQCHGSLEELKTAVTEGGSEYAGQILASLKWLEQIDRDINAFHSDYASENALLLQELQNISKLLSGFSGTGGGTDAETKELLSGIDTALQDLNILMNDRLLSVLDKLSGSSDEMAGSLKDAGITLAEIKDILSRMEAADMDTAKLEKALEAVRAAIAESGEANAENLSGMKEVLTGIQDALLEIKSGMAVKDNYTEVLNDIHALLEDMYKIQKLGTALDVADLLTDFAKLLDDGDTSFLDRMGTSLSNVANASKDHFPTSIPWDLIAVFTVFNAEPEAPNYELPLSVSSVGINETVSIDLSGFEQLSKWSRTLLSVLFVLLLIHLTRKSTSPDEGDG